ncbi:MAG: hypothetical protein ACKOW1_08880, partial [Novosphingobium sp.]
MEFRSGDEPTMGELDAIAAADAPVKTKQKEAGKGPAIGMAEKSEAGSDALVMQAGAEAIAKAVVAAALP